MFLCVCNFMCVCVKWWLKKSVYELGKEQRKDGGDSEQTEKGQWYDYFYSWYNTL